ncbi:MAG: hypothetical protein PVH88_09890 [Ignavibacteria bacterium]|jgi:alanyl-tRNA synthetase
MAKEYPPNMHTAEHLLNQTMVRMFDKGRSFSAHIEKKKSKCDYRFDRNLTEKEITQIQSIVNEKINSDLPVTEEFYSFDEVKNRFDFSKLPDKFGDTVRIVKIGDYDLCPCIGKHVNSTGELGEFKIISTSFENDILRIRFKLLNSN